MTHIPRDAARPRFSNNWTGAAVLLVVAAALFAGELGFHIPGSAWSLLLVVPAAAAAIACVRSVRLEGATSRTIFQGLLCAGFVALAALIVFGANIGLLWPAILVVIAISALLGGRTK